MNPRQQSQIVPDLYCQTHNEKVFMVELKENCNKAVCPKCVEKKTREDFPNLMAITTILEKYNQKIKDRYLPDQNKFKQIKQLLGKLANDTAKTLLDLNQQVESKLTEIDNQEKTEINHFENLQQYMTITKLEELAEIMNDSRKPEPLKNQIREFIEYFREKMSAIISSQKQTLDQISSLFGKLIVKQIQKLENPCFALATNQKQLIGGIGTKVKIWENGAELKQIDEFTGHKDMIGSIAIYNSGDLFVTSSSLEDNILKLWKKSSNQWICVYQAKQHTRGITDLQLTPNQNQLISASRDKTINIWQLNGTKDVLQLNQTLKDHNHEVGYVSISLDGKFMVTSSFQNFMILYSKIEDWRCTKQEWRIFCKIESEGRIKRVCFIGDYKFVCQQVDSPKLIVYKINGDQQFQTTQKIPLNEPDNQDILFPMIHQQNKILCKNNKKIYIINENPSGLLHIEQIILGQFRSGCMDESGKNVIFGGNQLEIYG